MVMEDTTVFTMVGTQAQAQELLDQGWELLGLFDYRDGNNPYAEYHLGRATEPTSSAGMFMPKRMHEQASSR